MPACRAALKGTAALLGGENGKRIILRSYLEGGSHPGRCLSPFPLGVLSQPSRMGGKPGRRAGVLLGSAPGSREQQIRRAMAAAASARREGLLLWLCLLQLCSAASQGSPAGSGSRQAAEVRPRGGAMGEAQRTRPASWEVAVNSQTKCGVRPVGSPWGPSGILV